MGYHDAREIPNYWTYAENFVLQDNMFESDASWSLPEHLYMVSGWSAACPDWTTPSRCTAPKGRSTRKPRTDRPLLRTRSDLLPWTDITYLLHNARRELGATTSSKAASPTASPTKR